MLVLSPALLVGDDRIRAVRLDRARGDLDAVGRRDERLRYHAGRLQAGDAEAPGAGGDRRRAEGEAIHCHPVERRQVAVGVDGGAQDAPVGGGERAVLGG